MRSFKGVVTCGLVFVMLLSNAALASSSSAGAHSILGVWLTGDRDAKINIYKCGAKAKKICGRIVWAGKGPQTDIKNPNPALRSRPILGLKIMKGFSYAGKNKWDGGRLYDPKSGNTYRGSIRLASPDRLKLRGYILLPLFGRTDTWTRVRGTAPE